MLWLFLLFDAVNLCFSTCVTTGYGDPSSYISLSSANTGYGIIAESGYYEFSCCGVIEAWEFHARVAGELHLMVWRKSGSTYTLVGKNVLTIKSGAAGEKIRYPIRELDRISIIDGDFIGWYTPGAEIIPYSSHSTYPHNYRMTTMGVIDDGNTYDWSSITYTHDRAYAIRAYTTDDTAPFFTNLQREVIIYDDEPINANIYRVTYYNGEGRDTLTWSYTSTNANIVFNTATEYVYLTVALSTGTYTIAFTITDSCLRSVTESLTIKVLNSPLRISNLPGSILLNEDNKEGRLLYTLNINERQTTDVIICSLTSVDPNIASSFTVTKISGTSDYGIYLLANATFNYEVSDKHTLTISCTDAKNTAVTGRFVVYLKKNQPPKFENVTYSVELEASSTFLGDLIFSLPVTDTEGDTLIFSMTTEPSNGPFEIRDYGDIIATADMSDIFVPAYDLKVTVTDGRTPVGPKIVSVHIKNMNDKPVITNLPLPYPFRIEENTAVGTTLYQVRVRDLDPTDNHYMYGAFNETSGSSFFTFTSDGYLTISADIDYESIPSKTFLITVTATDSKDTATASISISITDQNEAPVFHQTGYSVEQDEGSQNTAFPFAGFIIDDPDATDPKTYWLDCGNDTWRFTMDRTTGNIVYAYNYDLDKLLTTQYNCKVKAKDSGFNTCTSSLVINIKDINDHAPYFNQTQYAFYITPYETVGTQIGNVTAYDIDLLEFGTITYKLDMTAYTSLYIQIDENGTLYVNQRLDSNFYIGDVMTLTLTAIDYGGLQTSVTIWLVFEEINTTKSTTPTPITISDSPENSLWFTALGVLSSCIIIIVLYFGVKYSKDCVSTTIKSKKIPEKSNSGENKLRSIDAEKPAQNPLFVKKHKRLAALAVLKLSSQLQQNKNNLDDTDNKHESVFGENRSHIDQHN